MKKKYKNFVGFNDALRLILKKYPMDVETMSIEDVDGSIIQVTKPSPRKILLKKLIRAELIFYYNNDHKYPSCTDKLKELWYHTYPSTMRFKKTDFANKLHDMILKEINTTISDILLKSKIELDILQYRKIKEHV